MHYPHCMRILHPEFLFCCVNMQTQTQNEMKSITLCCLLLISSSLSTGLYAQKADDIVGTWFNTEKDAKIEIYPKNGKYFGKIVWLKNPTDGGKARTDTNNPEEAMRSRQLMGLNLLQDFEYDDGTWEDGTIYDPKNGKTYSCVISMENENTLEVRGYVGVPMFGRTVTWTRVE